MYLRTDLHHTPVRSSMELGRACTGLTVLGEKPRTGVEFARQLPHLLFVLASLLRVQVSPISLSRVLEEQPILLLDIIG
jgi:hypothetical protein